MVPCGGTSQDPLMSLAAVVICIHCPPPQRITAAHCTNVYVNSCLGVLTHCCCTAVHSAYCIHQYFENTLHEWSIMQYSSSIPQSKFTEVNCVQHVMNLAYKSAAEVVLRSLPAVNTQPASRAQNANVFNKGLTHKHAVCQLHAVCMLSFF